MIPFMTHVIILESQCWGQTNDKIHVCVSFSYKHCVKSVVLSPYLHDSNTCNNFNIIKENRHNLVFIN